MEEQPLSKKAPINSSLQNKKIKIFPNPTSGFFTLSSKINTPNQVAVYNTLGEKSYEFRQSGNQAIIDFSNYPKGIYFLEVVYDNGRETQKIIIQ